MLKNSYTTADGGRLFVPGKTREHLEAHPEVGDLLEEVAGRLVLPKDGSFLKTKVDLGRIVGRSGCIEAPRIGIDDPALFAGRTGRRGYSRVTDPGVTGPEVSTVFVLAYRGSELDEYVLLTSFIGHITPEKEPWSARSREEFATAMAFWSAHALVYDGDVMESPFVSTWRTVLN